MQWLVHLGKFIRIIMGAQVPATRGNIVVQPLDNQEGFIIKIKRGPSIFCWIFPSCVSSWEYKISPVRDASQFLAKDTSRSRGVTLG